MFSWRLPVLSPSHAGQDRVPFMLLEATSLSYIHPPLCRVSTCCQLFPGEQKFLFGVGRKEETKALPVISCWLLVQPQNNEPPGGVTSVKTSRGKQTWSGEQIHSDGPQRGWWCRRRVQWDCIHRSVSGGGRARHSQSGGSELTCQSRHPDRPCYHIFTPGCRRSPPVSAGRKGERAPEKSPDVVWWKPRFAIRSWWGTRAQLIIAMEDSDYLPIWT